MTPKDTINNNEAKENIYDFDIFEKSKAVEMTEKFLSQVNTILVPNFGRGIDVQKYLESQQFDEKIKAVTGAGVATGSGLFQINYQPQISSMSPSGGVYRASGIATQDNVSGSSVQFVSHFGGTSDKFGTLTSGTTSTQDSTGTFYTQSFPFTQNIYRVDVYKSILQGNLTNPQAIIDLYSKDYSRDVLKFEDRRITENLLLDPNIAGTAIATSTNATLTLTLIDLKRKLLENGAESVCFGLNASQYAKLKSEQDANGQFIRAGAVETRVTFSQVGVGFQAGLVAYLDGTPVMLNHGIKSVYTATGNNITALTGGARSALIAYDPMTVGVANGINYLEGFRVFEDTTTYDKGIVAFRGQHNIAAGAINPSGIQYAHVPA